MTKRYLLCFLISGSLCGCGKLALQHSELSSTAATNDFKKSTVTISGPTFADGTSLATVTFQLINSNGQYVVGFTPTFSLAPNTGVNASACTSSSKSGLSVCTLTSTVAGTKVLTATNLSGLVLTQNALFVPPNSLSSISMVSSSQQHASSGGGYSMMSSLGLMNASANTTAGGWQTNSNSQTMLSSQ
jgi:hypothetical protein